MPGLTISHLLLIPSISTLILSSLPVAQAYIPAVPINDTSSLNLTDSSSISISWRNPPGVYSGSVSYQLEADIPTNGTTTGALVHFSEGTMGPNLTTSTPWIAFISCDLNETGASMEDDVFTLARDRGAVSALLYTTQSASCALNPRYINDFEKPLDVFATRSVQIARVIDSQFRHTNETYYVYNGTQLNMSGALVNASLAGSRTRVNFNDTTYLIGTLEARNSTGQATPTDIPGSTQSPPAATNSRVSPSMIALYVITGLIGTCFILMLLLGWRRARRHPERYGRREEAGEAPRTTAAGLAQAMLDTFPVIKFNRRHAANGTNQVQSNAHSQSQSQFGGASPKRLDSDTELSILPHSGGEYRDAAGKEDSGSDMTHVQAASRAGSRKTMSRPTSGTGGEGMTLDGVVEAEAETPGDICPICLLEFEEGDDLRVLPCEREHMYHQGCIDPWLLRVSGSCPLCRKDFNVPDAPPSSGPTAPSTSISTASSSPAPPLSSTSASTTTPAPTAAPAASEPQGGFARYLAFMRRERRRTRRRADTSATAASGLSATSENEPGEEEEIESVVWGPGRGRAPSASASTSASAQAQAQAQVGRRASGAGLG